MRLYEAAGFVANQNARTDVTKITMHFLCQRVRELARLGHTDVHPSLGRFVRAARKDEPMCCDCIQLVTECENVTQAPP
jgi:hypothetical protein